jgi:hypothetical protein
MKNPIQINVAQLLKQPVGAEQSYEIDEPIELAEEKPYHIR